MKIERATKRGTPGAGAQGSTVSSRAFTRLSELHVHLSAVYAELAQQPAPAAPEQRPDQLIRIREACTRMCWSYSWAVKHWRELGGFRDLDGALKIRTDVLARHDSGNPLDWLAG